MPGLGTVVNVIATVLGGIIGVLFGKKINEEIRNSLLKVLGLAVMFVGAAGAFSGLLTPDSSGQKLETYGTMMLIISLSLGTFLGEFLKIEKRLDRFGEWLKVKAHATSDNGFVGAFVSTSLVICVGAMAVIGSIEDGISGNHTTLFAKSLLDFMIVIVMSSTLGKGAIFAFIPIGIFQGTITALARFAGPLFSIGNVIGDMSLVGSVMIFAVGVNTSFTKKFNVGNMLPSLVIAIIYSVINFYF